MRLSADLSQRINEFLDVAAKDGYRGRLVLEPDVILIQYRDVHGHRHAHSITWNEARLAEFNALTKIYRDLRDAS